MVSITPGCLSEEWRKLHNEDFYSLYFLPSIVKSDYIKSWRRTHNILCIGETMNAQTAVKNHLGDLAEIGEQC
jgi:hypothetical protein